jgi:hypothetical protein
LFVCAEAFGANALVQAKPARMQARRENLGCMKDSGKFNSTDFYFAFGSGYSKRTT